MGIACRGFRPKGVKWARKRRERRVQEGARLGREPALWNHVYEGFGRTVSDESFLAGELIGAKNWEDLMAEGCICKVSINSSVSPIMSCVFPSLFPQTEALPRMGLRATGLLPCYFCQTWFSIRRRDVMS